MIYTEDVIRLTESAANFVRILEAFRNDEGDPDGNDLTNPTVSAFAREALAQASTVEGPNGMQLAHLRLVNLLLAADVARLIAAIRAVAPPHDRPRSWMDADGSAIDELRDATRAMGRAIGQSLREWIADADDDD